MRLPNLTIEINMTQQLLKNGARVGHVGAFRFCRADAAAEARQTRRDTTGHSQTDALLTDHEVIIIFASWSSTLWGV